MVKGVENPSQNFSGAPPFAELAAWSNFTFLTGASHAEEMVARAAELGLEAVAIADLNTLAGVVRGHVAARDLNKRAQKLGQAKLREKTNIGHSDVVARAAARGGAAASHPSEGVSDATAASMSPPSPLGRETEGEGAAPGLGRADDIEPPSPNRDKIDPSGRVAVTGAAPRIDDAPGWAGRFVVASRLRLEDSACDWIALPTDRAAYGRLCRLLTIGKRRAQKGSCVLFKRDLEEHREGLILLAAPPDPLAEMLSLGSVGGAQSDRSAPPQIAVRRRSLAAADPRGGRKATAPGGRVGRQPALRPAGSKLEPTKTLSGLAPEAICGGADKTVPFSAALDEIRAAALAAPGDVFLLARPGYDGSDAERVAAFSEAADAVGAPMVATADPLMHVSSRRRLADILSCIRLRRAIDDLGRDALPNAERRLRAPAEMARLFAGHEAALARTTEIARRCRFSLGELRYEYPSEVALDPETGEKIDPQTRLEGLAREGLARRYPSGVPEKARKQCAHELDLIGRLGYAPYFLTVHDVVAFARSRGILAQGRGSAANSIVCYALGVTEIGPEIASMVFERFVSEARGEPPDIDVDFEHERREEVIQHVYARYGRHRAGICATVIHFRSRAAVREVGRAMGLSEDVIAAIASQSWGYGDDPTVEARLTEVGLDLADRRLRQTLQLVREIMGFPRHLSQHVGGFVMTEGRLDELVPIENAAMADRTVIEWDKDDIDALGILKVDALSLGMLTCIRKAFDLIEDFHGTRYALSTIPKEEPEVYDMLCEGDSIGVFQVESRAQINFLPRMRPRKFYDLVIEVAIVRPGPIQGDMVHPYIRRRQGFEDVSFPSKELEEVLGKTLGVPLFQEQAMQIAITAAGFTPEESDQLRRALATFRKSGTIHTFRERFVGGMLARGYDPEFAERCFSQIEGFGEYGFPESHAASFALLVYASAWLKRRHPAIFTCALLNAQPMGFYAPAQLIRDARRHGVEVRPISVNRSFWDNAIETDARGELTIRLGFRQIRGFSEEAAARLAEARGNGYLDPADVARRAGISKAAIDKLAEADAFADLGLARRAALWEAKAALPPPPLFAALLEGEGIEESAFAPPQESEPEAVVADYRIQRLTLRRHPAALVKERFFGAAASMSDPVAMEAKARAATPPALGPAGDRSAGRPRASRHVDAAPALTPTAALPDLPDGRRTTILGVVTVRQRPGSAKGVIFLTIEDESASANVVVWQKIYQRFRRAVIAGRLLRVSGRIQRDPTSKVTHLVAERVEDLSPLLDRLADAPLRPPTDHADEAKRPVNRPGRGESADRPSGRHPREQAKKLFPSRDFR